MSNILTDQPFHAFALSEDEILQGSVLSPLQKQVVQNMIAAHAVDRLNRQIDVDNIMKTVQEDAENHGYIRALRFLLEESDRCLETLTTRRNNPQVN